MARFTGGPNTEFISGRLATIFGSSGWRISKMVTLSLPGGENMGFPFSSQKTLASMPTITRWAEAEAGHAPRQAASAKPSIGARPEARLFMGSSRFVAVHESVRRVRPQREYGKRGTMEQPAVQDELAERPREEGLRFARRMYPPRVLGLAL